MILYGQYDLDIIEECNLHCAGCTSLDYLGYDKPGSVTISTMSLDMISELIDKIKQHVTHIEKINLVGGEPTLHPKLDQIIEMLSTSDLFGEIGVVTNGTNFTPDIVDVLEKVDIVHISDYLEAGGDDSITSTIDDMPFPYDVWPRWHFETTGQCDPIDPEENWISCYMRTFCRVITFDGLARCRVTANERIHVASWDDADALFKVMNRRHAFDRCGTCGTPKSADRYDWYSLKPDIDRKNYKRGIELIKARNI